MRDGIGFLVFLLNTRQELASLTFEWFLIWTAILFGTMVMFREERNPRSAWTSTALVTGLFAVMVMHQVIPDYSRNQTLFGDGSPVLAEIESGSQIATVAHEFSEVPYYLNRSAIAHWASADSPEIAEFVGSQAACLLVVYKNTPLDEIKHMLPAGMTSTIIGERGMAKLIRVESSGLTRVAESPKGTSGDSLTH